MKYGCGVNEKIMRKESVTNEDMPSRTNEKIIIQSVIRKKKNQIDHISRKYWFQNLIIEVRDRC